MMAAPVPNPVEQAVRREERRRLLAAEASTQAINVAKPVIL
jgi:hypothetical protein